jgi:hypothetical protein
MNIQSIILAYTPLQIIGVLGIIAVAIAVIIYFSTIWSVTTVRNIGIDIIPHSTDDRLRNSGLSGFSRNDPIDIRVTIDRGDRNSIALTGKQILVQNAKYSYDLMAFYFIEFSTRIDSNDCPRRYYLENISSERIYSIDPKNDSQIIIEIIGEYSCDASFHEDIIDSHYDVKIEYILPFDNIKKLEYLNRLFMDELSNIYLSLDSNFLSLSLNSNHVNCTENDNEDTYCYELDTVDQDFKDFRAQIPGLIDKQTSIRSLYFILCYKMLDPGFRSVGLQAIQEFVVLMSMHIEMIRMMFICQYIDSKNVLSRAEREIIRTDTVHNQNRIHKVSAMIRRFVNKRVTNHKRRSDIYSILDKYTTALMNIDKIANPNVAQDLSSFIPNTSNGSIMHNGQRIQYDRVLDVIRIVGMEVTVLSIGAKMYSEIMVELADQDSSLYSGEVSRLFTLICPLACMYAADDVTDIDSITDIDNDIKDTVISAFLLNAEHYLKSQNLNRNINVDLTTLFFHTIMQTPVSHDNNNDMDYDDIHTYINSIANLIWTTYKMNPRVLTRENKSAYNLIK